MLKHLQKFLKTEITEQKESEEIVAQESNRTEDLSAEYQKIVEQLESKLADISAKYEQAVQDLAKAEAAKVKLETEAKLKKTAARQERVFAVIGENEKATKLLSATEEMEDAQFEAIVSALAGSVEKEANSNMFKEVGVSSEATPTEIDPVKKLAAKMAAQFKQIKD
jgi:hypothetical protein